MGNRERREKSCRCSVRRSFYDSHTHSQRLSIPYRPLTAPPSSLSDSTNPGLRPATLSSSSPFLVAAFCLCRPPRQGQQQAIVLYDSTHAAVTLRQHLPLQHQLIKNGAYESEANKVENDVKREIALQTSKKKTFKD
ncbi:hypothetical protein HN51_036186, partial [Arachis hypogaea]